jgi:hypothetical protein
MVRGWEIKRAVSQDDEVESGCEIEVLITDSKYYCSSSFDLQVLSDT